MNCRKVQNLISAYVDCELSGLDMLAVRRHLSECSDCTLEFESLLKVKRAFGSMSPKSPSSFLADRICMRLDEAAHPARKPVFAPLRRSLTAFPGKMRLAAVGVGVFAVLLMLRAGQITTTNYAHIPMSPSLQVSIPAQQHDPIGLLSVTPVAEASSFGLVPLASPPVEPWSMYETRGKPTSFPAGAVLLPASY